MDSLRGKFSNPCKCQPEPLRISRLGVLWWLSGLRICHCHSCGMGDLITQRVIVDNMTLEEQMDMF